MWGDESRIQLPGRLQMKQSSYYFRKMGETVRIKAGTEIEKQGEIPSHCYFIRNGLVAAGINLKDGDERILFVFEKDCLILGQYLLTSNKNQLCYTANTEVLAQKISYQELVQGMKSCFNVTMDVMNAAVGFSELSLYRMIGDWEENAAVKICNQLIDMAQLFGNENDNAVMLNVQISQTMLGKMTGVHRVTVNREMKKLKEKGLVFIEDGYYYISDIKQLIQYRNEQSGMLE